MGNNADDPAIALGSGLRVPEPARQAVLDAAAMLQVRRSEAAAAVAQGPVSGIEIAARGSEINPWMARAAGSWRELLSVRPATTAAELRYSLPNNRAQVNRGMRMVSVFDRHGTEAEAQILLAHETVGTYLLSVAPVQVKIVDRSMLILQGPTVDGEPTVMTVRSAPCLEAAWRYWEAIMDVSVPVTEMVASLAGLTPRQHQVVALLATGANDDAIASALDVSVRTVRSDVAAILDALGVRTRFAAGMRLRTRPGDEDG